MRLPVEAFVCHAVLVIAHPKTSSLALRSALIARQLRPCAEVALAPLSARSVVARCSMCCRGLVELILQQRWLSIVCARAAWRKSHAQVGRLSGLAVRPPSLPTHSSEKLDMLRRRAPFCRASVDGARRCTVVSVWCHAAPRHPIPPQYPHLAGAVRLCARDAGCQGATDRSQGTTQQGGSENLRPRAQQSLQHACTPA